MHSYHASFISLYSLREIENRLYDQPIYASEERLTPKKRPVKSIAIYALVAICLVLLFLLLVLLFSEPLKFQNNDLKQQNNSTATKTSQSDLAYKREFVRNMTLEAWNAYVQYAWGQDYIVSVRNGKTLMSARIGQKNSGLSIVTSMSTLWVMGLTEQFDAGQQWIVQKLNLREMDQKFRVYSLVTDYVGGLLSCYALTNDTAFLDKAEEIERIVEPFYLRASGLPHVMFNPKTNSTTSQPTVSLSDLSVGQLELSYLSELTSNSALRTKLQNLRQSINGLAKPNSLYLRTLNSRTGNWTDQYSSLYSKSRRYYQSLLRRYIQSSGSDVESLKEYIEAIDSADRHQLFFRPHQDNKTDLLYARNLHISGIVRENSMTSDGCYLGALLSLGSKAIESYLTKTSPLNGTQVESLLSKAKRHKTLAEELTKTCHAVASQTRTKLPPYTIYMEVDEDDIKPKKPFKSYDLNPELAESYFTLYRLTRAPQYRQYAWEMAQAIYTHCRLEKGYYSGLDNVDQIPVKHYEWQRPHFIASTLKYLYLIFTDGNDNRQLPLSAWIFNGADQPLPILAGHEV